MIRELIQGILATRVNKKKYEVIKLRWQKAELEKQLRELKNK